MIVLYSMNNKGNFPRTQYEYEGDALNFYTGTDAKDPFGTDGPKANDVTAAFFLLETVNK